MKANEFKSQLIKIGREKTTTTTNKAGSRCLAQGLKPMWDDTPIPGQRAWASDLALHLFQPPVTTHPGKQQ